MNMSINKLNEKTKIFADNVSDFIYGNLFPITIALVILFFWIADLSIIGFAILMLTLSFILVLYSDLTPALPLIFMIPMPFRDTDVFGTFLPYIFIGIAVVALIINFIKFPWKKPRFTWLFWAHVILTISMLLGGIFSVYLSSYQYGLGVIALPGAGMLAVYFIIKNRTTPPENFDFKCKFSASLVIAANLACIQMLYALASTYFFDYLSFGDILDIIPDVEMNPTFCWANINGIATIAMFALPFVCYLMIKTNKLLPLFAQLIFFYLSILISAADIPLMLSLLAVIPMALVIYKSLRANQARLFSNIFHWLLLGAVIVLIALGVTGIFSSIWNKLVASLSDDSGRSPLYRNALSLFSQYPIFGVSYGHTYYSIISNNTLNYVSGFSHSTFFHALASSGIFGILAFAFLYFQRFRTMGKNNTPFGFLSLISVLAFSVYSMVDVGEFMFLVIYATIIVSVCEFTNENGNAVSALPLITNPNNLVISH